MRKIVEQLRIDLESQQTSKLRIYKKYYEGQHDILSNYPKNTGKRSNNIEVHNFCKLFIDNNTGYLLGNPISLNYLKDTEIADVTISDLYQEKLGHKIRQTDQKLMQYQQIYGYAFELNYVNSKGEFGVDIVSPLKMSVIREGNKVQYALYEREILEDSKLYDFFDVLNGMIYTIEIKGYKQTIHNTQRNIIDNPIIVISNNWEQLSEIEPIKSLNDSYNTISSDLANEISDNRNSYLYIKGAKINNEVLNQMNSTGIIVIPESSASTEIGYLTKDINDKFVQNKLDQLKNELYTLAGQVDFNDSQIGSNTSSLALRNKLTNLDNKLSLKEGFLREVINIRLRNFKTYLDATNEGLKDELMDTKAVDIVIVKNIPTSNLEVAEMITSLVDSELISRETALTQLSFISDSREELRRIEEDKINRSEDNISILYQERLGEILDEGLREED